MSSRNADLIRLLEAELDFMEGGGYGSPAGEPPKERPMFDHSLACINHWFVPGHESDCCDDCILLDAVPDEHKTQSQPCHFIPLNAAGDTAWSLEQAGDRERLEEEVKNWLQATIRRLKADETALGSPDVKY